MKFKYAIIITIYFIVLGCSSSTDIGYETSAIHNFAQSDGVLFTLNINQSNFALDDSLKIKFAVNNISIVRKTFYFSTQQQFGFNLTDQFNQVVMSYPSIVQPVSSRFTLNPGKTKLFIFSGQYKNHEGNYIDKGNYRLSTYLFGDYPEVILNIIID